MTRTPTKIERLAPEITAIAAELGDEVHYYGGDYFLVNCQRSLWNTRHQGALTAQTASVAAHTLRTLADRTAPARARPLLDRALAVVEMLRGAKWRPGHIAEVTTEALDRGWLDRWAGTYTLGVSVLGERVEVRDMRDRDEALGELECAVRARWPE